MTTAEAEARALLVTERELEKLQATQEYKRWSAQNGRTAKKSLIWLGATIAILSVGVEDQIVGISSHSLLYGHHDLAQGGWH